jgi:hemin uptake protein HemP
MSTALAPAIPLPRNTPTSPAPQMSAGNIVSSRSLLGHANTLIIEHQGMHYTLRATRNGKLILTK